MYIRKVKGNVDSLSSYFRNSRVAGCEEGSFTSTEEASSVQCGYCVWGLGGRADLLRVLLAVLSCVNRWCLVWRGPAFWWAKPQIRFVAESLPTSLPLYLNIRNDSGDQLHAWKGDRVSSFEENKTLDWRFWVFKSNRQRSLGEVKHQSYLSNTGIPQHFEAQCNMSLWWLIRTVTRSGWAQLWVFLSLTCSLSSFLALSLSQGSASCSLFC